MELRKVTSLVSDSYRYKTEKGEISLIQPSEVNFDTYEIFCINGGLFNGVERFDTFHKAEERICDLLIDL